MNCTRVSITAALLLSTTAVVPAECPGAGPQSPRDIGSAAGANPRIFSLAPAASRMNLCNIHMHRNAEHRGPDFATFAGEGEFGGYQCRVPSGAKVEGEQTACNNVSVGDTVEFHWVYSTCDVGPGAGLGSCLADNCANPQLRVETQVFLVVDDDSAMDLTDLAYSGSRTGNYHQPQALPVGTGAPVTYLGSTTGPSYSDQVCSPLQVTWSVRPDCAQIDIGSLARWCDSNPFEEQKAHGVRKLVTDPAMLSPIGAAD